MQDFTHGPIKPVTLALNESLIHRTHNKELQFGIKGTACFHEDQNRSECVVRLLCACSCRLRPRCMANGTYITLTCPHCGTSFYPCQFREIGWATNW